MLSFKGLNRLFLPSINTSHLCQSLLSTSPHLTTTLFDLQSQLKSIRRHILYLKAALGPPKYPTPGPSTAAAVFVEERTGNTGFVPGLGSSLARPSMKQMYRESHAAFKKLSEEKQKEYEDKAMANKIKFREEFSRWRQAHGDKKQMRELLEAEEKVKELKIRIAGVRRAEKNIGKA